MRHDVTYSPYVEVDEICNLDCPASPLYYQAHRVKTINWSVHGSIDYLAPDKRCKAKVLLVSSSELSEDTLRDPSMRAKTATSTTGGPRACYDEGNRCAETIFYDYHSQHGVASKVVQTFNTDAPGKQFNDGCVLSNFIYQSLQGEPITVCGAGNQISSFCSVGDLIEGIVVLIATGPKVTGSIYVGDLLEVTIMELANEIRARTGCNTEIERPVEDPGRRCPHISLMTSLAKWQPKILLQTGLLLTIENFLSRFKLHEPAGSFGI
jgi:UDP-glucuronate decarboxylase